MDEIILNSRDWYAEHGITLHTGDPVETIDRKRREVRARSGLTVPYDRLLLATGSDPFIIPVPGHDLPGVLGYRDIADVDAMLTKARSHKQAVVIGGGLLGLEAAYGLHCERGIVVDDTMLTYDPRIYAVGECVPAPRGLLRPGRTPLRTGQGLCQSPGAPGLWALSGRR